MFAEQRIGKFIDEKTEIAQERISHRHDRFQKQYTKAIHSINFKAVLAEQVGWSGFREMQSTPNIQFAEIL